MNQVDKEYVISDSSVNTHGFRLLTDGYILDEFAKNPIGYYMHNRDAGVLVKWTELKKKGDKVIGYPNINPSHPRAAQTIEEINNGFLNAASVGHIVIIDSTDDLSLKLPGQTGPTVTKWFNRECSLVDIPSNKNSLCLYDAKGDVINLNLFAQKGNFLSAQNNVDDNLDIEALLKAAIKDNDISPEVAQSLRKQYQNKPGRLQLLLKDFSKMRVDYLMSFDYDQLDKNGLLAELKEKYLQGFQQKFYKQFGKDHKSVEGQTSGKGTDIKSEIKRLKEFAIKNKDIDPEVANMMEANFKDDPEKLKKLFQDAPKERIDFLMDRPWDKLDKEGLLEELKQKYLQGFKQKYLENFGVHYKQ